jgi:hypothetical protein
MGGATWWGCEVFDLTVTPRNRVGLHVEDPLLPAATNVGGAVTGIYPIGTSCMNLATVQRAQILHQKGSPAARQLATGPVVQPGEHAA